MFFVQTTHFKQGVEYYDQNPGISGAWVPEIMADDAEGKDAIPPVQMPAVQPPPQIHSLQSLRQASTEAWQEDELLRLKTSGDIYVVLYLMTATTNGVYLEVRVCKFYFSF